MSDLLAARSTMALSLAFHIIFAAIGIAMPWLMAIAEYLWLRRGDRLYLSLARRWARGTAIFFAVGAVSGTVLSFELGLLWPTFMRYAGGIIGMPFSLEGFAFFTEAIFLGIYLYGWERVPPRMHLLAGILVGLSGVFSGLFVIMANSWMNTPTGFRLENGQPVDINPIAAMFNPAWPHEALHMTIAAFLATGFGVAGLHALMLLRRPTDRFHRAALGIALSVGVIAALIMPISGDYAGRQVYRLQPAKLAAMEGEFETQRCAPLRIGGIPIPSEGTTRFALEIPCGLSLLAAHNPNAEVKGLNAFPPSDRPNPIIPHLAFQIMVGIGVFLFLLGLWATWSYVRRRALPASRWFLRLLIIAAPLGFLGIETGWFVTEVGRQPWIIYGVMRTKDAVTPMTGLTVPFALFTLLYFLLAIVVAVVFWRQVVQRPDIPPLPGQTPAVATEGD